MEHFSVIILAAGNGTRMKSSLPKVMHKLSGKPLIGWTIESISDLNPDVIIVVLAAKRSSSSTIKEYLSNSNVNNIDFVYQNDQFGSAHAVMQAEVKLKNYDGCILIINGDVPLFDNSVLLSLMKNNKKTNSSVTILSSKVKNPFGYGRIIKKNGFLERIVEEKDANLSEKRINEINSGVYCFDKNLWKAISIIKPNNIKNEYYLTDAISIIKGFGKNISLVTSKHEIKGINNRIELLQAELLLKTKKINNLLDNGVTIIDSLSVYISIDAKIGVDTVIYPGVFIDINVSISKNCIIKGASYIINSKIGSGSIISYSYIENAIIKKNVTIGPFSHIRHGSIINNNVKIGNFSETKKTILGKNSKISHLSYIGDAKIGENVNVGAGTITCNYDGKKKYITTIGSKSFIGSNVNLIAPVKIGDEVLIAAGSTITNDVPSHKFVIARTKQKIKNRKNL
ncbi:MAG: bifunctional UDP-N-acetylglucosamine diphosphorylase/glucosamine-1-phosphate N-acetyltransferase GlmU [Endomicrobium sp.]|jgi:bifunctional UDP-N-acetylglucosamine pyrophosphorylase/glucosamine-1-phosphate N-acetyltransferase|nr:bifunctional UDP-N-acetylglucosamine diphosphorylase/glucosamine-1-phosphate N-acetyltransferase GlmU [Endomicrobium sp.]